MKYALAAQGVFFIGILIFLSLLRVRTVECTLAATPCPQEVTQQIDAVIGSSLLFTSFEATLPTHITDPTLLVTSIEKRLPETLSVSLSKEQPAYVLTFTNGTAITVYESGVTQQHSSSEDEGENTAAIPQITTNLPLEVVAPNQTMHPKYHAVLTKFSLSLYKNTIKLQNSIWATPQTLVLTLESGVEVLLSFEDAARQLDSVALVLQSSEFRERAATITQIDMRYTYPVLRTNE